MSNLPVIANRYQLEREIGRGGAGVVYAVKHVHTGERLAMKVLLSHAANQPDIVQRFRREMQASARVRSEHVVRITDADIAPELDGAPFLVMELLNGADLGRLVVERGPCPKEEVIWILGQAARGLDRAHAAGIVHRDLKPENLFLHLCDDQRLVVKLLDFGIARMNDGPAVASAQARMTQDGAILGTPLFLTPEQALGEIEKIGPGTDVWPMGLIACELLHGSSYWSDEQMTTLLAKIIFKQLVPPSDKGVKLGPQFDAWFLRSCAREPTDRWPSIGAQIEALADALQVDRALLNAPEPPPALRAWLDARMARADRNKTPEMSMAALTDTALPSRPSAAMALLRPSASMAQIAGPRPSAELAVVPTEQRRSAEDVPPADLPRSRRNVVISIVSSAMITVALVLGGIGIMRMRTATPTTLPPPERGDLARLTPPIPPVVQTAVVPPTPTPEVKPSEPPDPTDSDDPRQKSRRGSGKKHGKKPPRDPSGYDPSSP